MKLITSSVFFLALSFSAISQAPNKDSLTATIKQIIANAKTNFTSLKGKDLSTAFDTIYNSNLSLKGTEEHTIYYFKDSTVYIIPITLASLDKPKEASDWNQVLKTALGKDFKGETLQINNKEQFGTTWKYTSVNPAGNLMYVDINSFYWKDDKLQVLELWIVCKKPSKEKN